MKTIENKKIEMFELDNVSGGYPQWFIKLCQEVNDLCEEYHVYDVIDMLTL